MQPSAEFNVANSYLDIRRQRTDGKDFSFVSALSSIDIFFNLLKSSL